MAYDRVTADAQSPGDSGVRHALEAAKQKDLAATRRQGIDDTGQTRKFAAMMHHVRRHALPKGAGRRVIRSLCFQRPAAPALVIDRQIGGDAEQVASRIARWRPTGFARDPQPCLVRKIGSQRRIAETTRQEADQRLPMLGEALQEGITTGPGHIATLPKLRTIRKSCRGCAGCSTYAATMVLKPPQAMRLGSNGMSGGCFCIRGSAITLALTLSRCALDL